MSETKSFGTLLKIARKEKRLRQEDFVEKINQAGFLIDQASLSRWETERNFPETNKSELILWMDNFLNLSGKLVNAFENRTSNITVKSLLKIFSEVGPTKSQLTDLFNTLENHGMQAFSVKLSQLSS